jgi:aspartyl-tRNA(Asn)/glutamyl-tRNA(Gln) amidotransferase subunit C
MSISSREVAHIARLARLKLSSEEMDGLTHDLAEILDYVQRIAALESSEEAPAEEDQTSSTPLREDIVQASLPVEEALRPSARHDESFFRVPPVIDREEGP